MSHSVCLAYDFDAVAGWTSAGMPEYRSWGVYGAETCVPRLLDLHDRTGVPSTWFVPGHTIESFPEAAGEIHDRGHEIGHHGWSHDPLPSFGSREAERRDFVRGIEAVEELTGETPTGFRNPAGGFSEHTVDLLREFDFEWDSSGTERDLRPYYLREPGTLESGKPYRRGDRTDIVTVPVPWHRDDWLQLFPVASDPQFVSYGHEPDVFHRWRTELAWTREHVEEGVLTLLLHPQCAGRAPFIAELEAFIEDVKAMADTDFADVSTVVSSFSG